MKRLSLALACTAALLVPSQAAAFQLRLFHIPGGNIGCVMTFGSESQGGGARCDIAKHAWVAPPTPKWCELDFGNGLDVGAHRKAEFVCAGDTVLKQGKVLPTGQSRKLGPYRCESLEGAVRCLNGRTRHGFYLSEAVAERF